MFPKRKVALMVAVIFSFLFVLTITGFCSAGVLEISFLAGGPGNGGNNKHEIYANSATDGGWGEGPVIVKPEWIGSAIKPPLPLRSRSKPVCYTRSKPGTPSRMRVELLIKDLPPTTKLDKVVGMDGNIQYFQQEKIEKEPSGAIKVTMAAKVDLPATVSVLTKTFTWKVGSLLSTLPSPHSPLPVELAKTTHKIYVVYDTPITAGVEGQTNKLTPKRLDFSCGAAAGKGDLPGVTYAIAAKVYQNTGTTYGSLYENPRWLFYARTSNINLDCHHRAAMAASAFGIVGIKGYVHKVYATCYPVPPGPYGPNPTVNNYVSAYTNDRFKWRSQGGSIERLMFPGNNFEGNIRVEDGSADDGNIWYTIWPLKQHLTAKELLIWYGGSGQYWNGSGQAVPIPVNQLANKPTIIGGPN